MAASVSRSAVSEQLLESSQLWTYGMTFRVAEILNLIQKQLGNRIHDVEWTNGTSYYYDLEHDTCTKFTFEVGILRPDWLRDATYVGIRESDGFSV